MKASQRGFTLIELVIAVGILSLLMVMLFGALHLAARTVERQSTQIDRSAKVALVQKFLRDELSDARPLASATQRPRAVDFDGSSERLAFISPAVESVRFGGLQRLEIALEGDPDVSAGTLFALWRPFRITPDSNATVRRTLLLDNVRAAAFAYFGDDPQSTNQGWHDSWHGRGRLPLLVHISLVFSDGTPMPDLTIALRGAPGAADLTQGQRF